MPTPDYYIPDVGDEITVGDTVLLLEFLVPSAGWYVSNTGSKAIVVNFDAAAAPTRTQPVGAGTRYLGVGASEPVPTGTYRMTCQDSADANTSTMAISKG